MELTHISLCTGYGGIDLGLKRALGRVSTIAYSEIEAFAIANLVSKIESGWLDCAPIWTDLKTFPWQPFQGKVDILSGGFPCQPFSTAGRRDGDEDPRHLWPHIVKGVVGLDFPPIVFFENVEGIISSKLAGDTWSDPQGTPVLLHILRELERMGYEPTAGIFSASEVGAPHQRKRVFILGVHSKLNTEGRALVSTKLNEVESDPKSQQQTAWPAGRGQAQFEWEPPRVTDKNPNENDYPQGAKEGDSEDWIAYRRLCSSVDNRTDELRLLGNGVVPQVAEKAFKTLWRELNL